MFDIFSNRNKSVTKLIKLGTYIGRSLRENVQVFTIDSMKNQVCYLTESGSFISGDYIVDGKLSLHNIKIQSSEIISDEKKFDSFVNEQVSLFVKNVQNNEFNNADVKFSDILSLWEERFKLHSLQKLIAEKSEYSHTNNIFNTKEYDDFVEVTPLLVKFINENAKEVLDAEFVNSIRKIKVTSAAFNLNKITMDKLVTEGRYIVNESINTNTYEALCQSELLRMELLEAKRSFDYSWTNTKSIKALSRMVHEEDETKIEIALIEAITEVPFLAMATKGQIAAVVESNMVFDNSGQKAKEAKEFASKIFEMKKPIRSVLNKLLSEKYNINVLNLKEPISLKSLAENCAEVFTVLSSKMDEASVLHNACVSMARLLNSKGGVEAIDVNDILCTIVEDAGINITVPEFKLSETIDFAKVFELDFNAKDIIKSIKEATKTPVAEPQEAAPEEKVDPLEAIKQEEPSDEEIQKKDREAFLLNLKTTDDIIRDIISGTQED